MLEWTIPCWRRYRCQSLWCVPATVPSTAARTVRGLRPDGPWPAARVVSSLCQAGQSAHVGRTVHVCAKTTRSPIAHRSDLREGPRQRGEIIEFVLVSAGHPRRLQTTWSRREVKILTWRMLRKYLLLEQKVKNGRYINLVWLLVLQSTAPFQIYKRVCTIARRPPTTPTG